MHGIIGKSETFDLAPLLEKLSRNHPYPLVSRQLAASKVIPSLRPSNTDEIATLLSAAAEAPAPATSKQQALDNFEQEILAIEVEQLLTQKASPRSREEYFGNSFNQPFVMNPEDAPLCVKRALAHQPLSRREKFLEAFRETIPFLRF